MDESYNYLNEEPAIIIDQQQGQISPHHQQDTHEPQGQPHQSQQQQQPSNNESNGDGVPEEGDLQGEVEGEEEEEEETMGDGIFSNVTQGLEGNYRNMMMAYWQETIDSIEHDEHDFKNHQLPLARIKKVMKTDEEVRMISAEAPILFAKGCDVFITELTMRAWIHAEENKRRTLQKSDIAAALQKSDMFDFLIDIVPREDEKQQPKRTTTSSRQNSLQHSLNFGGSNTTTTTTATTTTNNISSQTNPSSSVGAISDQSGVVSNGDSSSNILDTSVTSNIGTSQNNDETSYNEKRNVDGEFIQDGGNNTAGNDYRYNDLTTYENRF